MPTGLLRQPENIEVAHSAHAVFHSRCQLILHHVESRDLEHEVKREVKLHLPH